MKKIELIKSTDKISLDSELQKSRKEMDVNTFTNMNHIASVVDLFHDVDKLVELGYNAYLEECKGGLRTCDDIIIDTLHARNLYCKDEKSNEEMTMIEKQTYLRRSCLKTEILFLETNETCVNGLIKWLERIKRFSDRKNERFYTPKVLSDDFNRLKIVEEK